MNFFRNLDLALLALALPVFIIADLPVLGWVTAAVIWLLWRGIGEWSDRRASAAAAANDPRKMAGIAAGSMIGRGWLLDRKSTRLNSSHANISYAVFCLKKK